jgi:hypothetical protein
VRRSPHTSPSNRRKVQLFFLSFSTAIFSWTWALDLKKLFTHTRM